MKPWIPANIEDFGKGQPVTLTDAVGLIKTALTPTAGYNWVDMVYGRVQAHDERKSGGDRPQIIPMANDKKGDYVDCRPNDNFKSVIFFYAPDPENSDFNRAMHSKSHAIRTQRPVSLYGWINSDKLNPKTYISDDGFAEPVKVELKAILKWIPCVIRIGNWQDGSVDKVFQPFIVSDLNRKYDRLPYLCFRLDLMVQCVEQYPNSHIL